MNNIQKPARWPLDRSFFVANVTAARDFLQTTDGTVLHEMAHYAAANSKCLLPGHLVISDNGRSGAFVFEKTTFQTIESDKDLQGFIAASGALAELYFCNNTEYNRCRFDISHYNHFFDHAETDEFNFRNTIVEWKLKYNNSFRNILANVELNYHLVRSIISSNRYFMDNYHVVPSSELTPSIVYPEAARAAEKALMGSQEARATALRRFAAGRNDAPNRDPLGSRLTAMVQKIKAVLIRTCK